MFHPNRQVNSTLLELSPSDFLDLEVELTEVYLGLEEQCVQEHHIENQPQVHEHFTFGGSLFVLKTEETRKELLEIFGTTENPKSMEIDGGLAEKARFGDFDEFDYNSVSFGSNKNLKASDDALWSKVLGTQKLPEKSVVLVAKQMAAKCEMKVKKRVRLEGITGSGRSRRSTPTSLAKSKTALESLKQPSSPKVPVDAWVSVSSRKVKAKVPNGKLPLPTKLNSFNLLPRTQKSPKRRTKRELVPSKMNISQEIASSTQKAKTRDRTYEPRTTPKPNVPATSQPKPKLTSYLSLALHIAIPLATLLYFSIEPLL